MAVIPVSSITFYSGKPSNINSLRNYKRDTVNGLFPVQRMSDEFSSFRADNYNWRCLVFHHGDNLCLTSKTRQSVNSFYVVRESNLGPFCTSTEVSSSHRVYCTKGHVESSSEDASQRDDFKSYSLKTSIDKGQLNALDSYFRKLDSEENEHQSACMSVIDYQNGNGIKQQTESPPRIPDALLKMSGKSSQSPMKDGLASLDIYFSKLSTGLEIQKHTSSTIGENPEECNPLVISSTSSEEDLENGIMEPNSFTQSGEEENGENFQDLQPYDEASDLYLISILVSINIAVFLFEIASPIKNSDLETLSLPLLYGAKINRLILDGEWWRLVTPMFLHSGFLHVALSCWVLLTFGPQVCRGYGPFTFFLIYILGGICGNLTSFLHTPELTVCGTGPVFAIIGAWLIYQLQTKEVISEEEESLFWKAVIATVGGFVLCNFGRIDDWTHIGATFSGLVYGFLTCPTLLFDNASSRSDQKEGVALLQRQADPCKSFFMFALVILILSSLIFLVEPQLETLELDELDAFL